MMPKLTDTGSLIAQAEKTVVALTDPELKRIAFQRVLDCLLAPSTWIEAASKLAQVLAVVVGVMISIVSLSNSREAEARAREAEAKARKKEDEKFAVQRAAEFLALRQKFYLEAIKSADIMTDPTSHSDDEVKKAKKRFRELYVGELSLVEDIGVEAAMVDLAKVVDPDLLNLSEKQRAAYLLAHRLRDSLRRSWGLGSTADE